LYVILADFTLERREDGSLLQFALTVGPEWKGIDDYVFCTAWGEPVHPDTVSSLMATLIKAHNAARPDEGLPHVRLHDLRHVHTTTLLLAGTPVHVVAARLGHADPSITLRVYAHVISNQLSEAADTFAQVMKARELAAVSIRVSKKAPSLIGRGL
jgi:integrase